MGDILGEEWGYLMTIKPFKVNALNKVQQGIKQIMAYIYQRETCYRKGSKSLNR